MEILKFDGGKQSNKRNRLITAIAGAFFVAAVGSTFAANITINTNNTLEYGQGLTTAAACDTAMTIIPSNHYVNGANSAGTFYFDTITVYDAATTSTSTGLGPCGGKKLKISAWDSVTGSAALASCTVTLGTWSSGFTGTLSSCPTGAAFTAYGTTGFTIGYANPASSPNKLAGDVYKITIESSN